MHKLPPLNFAQLLSYFHQKDRHGAMVKYSPLEVHLVWELLALALLFSPHSFHVHVLYVFDIISVMYVPLFRFFHWLHM